MMRGRTLCAVTGLLLLLGLAQSGTAYACYTSEVTVSGVLKAGIAPAQPPSGPSTSFSELESSAAASGTIPLYDTLGEQHIARLYFWKLEPEVWSVRLYIDAAEISGMATAAGTPVGILEARLSPVSTYDQFGFATPTCLSQEPPCPWANGARVVKPAFHFPAFAEGPEFVVSIANNGGTGRCAQSSRNDVDGDGIDDFVVWNTRTGVWSVRTTAKQVPESVSVQWGARGDTPLTGDYTGDGTADLVVYRSRVSGWFVCPTDGRDYTCGGGFALVLGRRGDLPVQSDFDGDQVLDIAVYRKSPGIFIYRSSKDGTINEVLWGTRTNIPPS